MQFSCPCGVPPHVTSQKQSKSQRFATDGIDRATPGALTARQTGFDSYDGMTVLHKDRSFTASFLTTPATSTGLCYIIGTHSRDESNVMNLRLRTSVGTGCHSDTQAMKRRDSFGVTLFHVHIPASFVQGLLNQFLDPRTLDKSKRTRSLSPTGFDAVGEVIAVRLHNVMSGHCFWHGRYTC